MYFLRKPSGQNAPNTHVKRGKIAGVFVNLCVVGGIAAVVSPRFSASQSGGASLAQERTAARRSGMVLSTEALSAPMPPASDNAAPLYRKFDALDNALAAAKDAAAQKSDAADERILDAERRNPRTLTPADWNLVQQALSRRNAEIALLREAVRRPQCVFGAHEYVIRVDPMDAGNDVYDRAMSTMRRAGSLLVSESMAAAHAGQPADAMKSAVEARKVAQQAAAHRNLTGFLTAVDVEAQSLSAFKFILRTYGDDPEICRAVGTAAATPLMSKPLSEVLKVETAINQEMIDSIRASAFLSFSSAPGSFSRAEYGRMIEAFGVFQLNAMRRSIAVIDKRYAESAPVLQAIAAESTAKYPKGGAMPQSFMDWAQVAFTRDTITNVESVTRGSAAVLAFHAAKGKYPATLADAMPEPPVDAFDGKPLHYAVTEAGFVLSAAHQRARHKPEIASFSYPN